MWSKFHGQPNVVKYNDECRYDKEKFRLDNDNYRNDNDSYHYDNEKYRCDNENIFKIVDTIATNFAIDSDDRTDF